MSRTNVGNSQFTVWYSQAGAEAGRENPDGSELFRKAAAGQMELRGNLEELVDSDSSCSGHQTTFMSEFE